MLKTRISRTKIVINDVYFNVLYNFKAFDDKMKLYEKSGLLENSF